MRLHNQKWILLLHMFLLIIKTAKNSNNKNKNLSQDACCNKLNTKNIKHQISQKKRFFIIRFIQNTSLNFQHSI